MGEAASSALLGLDEGADAGRPRLGTKAATLARLMRAGFTVPAGVVVTPAAFGPEGLLPAVAQELTRRGRELGGGPFAVRSSALAEDRPEASFAGLYESVLDVHPAGLGAAVQRCWASGGSDRVSSYRHGADPAGTGMAVLVQGMVDAVAAGVAFTADPLTGDRAETVVNAVGGQGERLVGGADGEQWSVRSGAARVSRSGDAPVLTAGQAAAVADVARAVEAELGGPQDVEWALDRSGRLWLLQARPMTAVPDAVDWSPPAPGYWMRTFRLGEWLPEAVSPLFADWLLPRLEAGYLDGMRETVGVAVPFRYAVVNGWYYTSPPPLSAGRVVRTLAAGRLRLVHVLANALARAGHDPAGADRAVLARLAGHWRDVVLPGYRAAASAAEARLEHAGREELTAMVDRLAVLAGRYLWYLAIVGGSAWKMEAALARFCHRRLARVLGDRPPQRLLSGLDGIDLSTPGHAVASLDWHHPTAAELGWARPATADDEQRRKALADDRRTAEDACRQALRGSARLRGRFEALLQVSQRYAVLREQQSHDFTLAWPALRGAALRLGALLATGGHLDRPEDVFFLTRSEVLAPAADLRSTVDRRRATWQRQRRLAAPLTLGHGQKLAERAVIGAVVAARGDGKPPEGAVVGHPASPGHAVGPVHVVTGPEDFESFAPGEVLVARATAPAWTPLFSRAAAVVTDAGTLAAHASLIAREYGIPAVVGTGDATSRLARGQWVTVDGTAGTVEPRAAAPEARADGP